MNAAQPLLQPYRMGEFQLANRGRHGAADTLPCNESRPAVRRNYTFATTRQRASAGLIITEGTWISRDAVGWHDVPGLFTDAQVRAWSAVTDAVHREAVSSSCSCGTPARRHIPTSLHGTAPLAPSAVNPGVSSPDAVGK